jgi:hypothetical protein
MKKLLLIALLIVTVTASAFAGGSEEVHTAAVSNFKVEFEQASDVKWRSTEYFVKASFVLNHERMEAFYNLDGDRIGTSKAFNTEALPVKAKRAFAKKFTGFTVSQSIEFEGTDETAYFLSAENEKESVILKINSFGDLSTVQRTIK